jgi:hypothetical protein
MLNFSVVYSESAAMHLVLGNLICKKSSRNPSEVVKGKDI